MDRFQVVVTLLSFVYALALTHVLASAAAMILRRDQVRFSFVQALWMALAVLLLFNNWLSLAGLGAVEWTTRLSFEAFAFAVAQYAACALVSPRVDPSGPVDMVAHHQQHGRIFKTAFLVVAALALFSNLGRAAALDRALLPALASQWPIMVMMALTVLALWRREQWVQIVCAGVLILLTLIVVFV